MAYISGGSASFFSEEKYQEYLKKNHSPLNTRLRDKDETFFDAMLSDEADLTKTTEGMEIIKFIREAEL